MFKLDPPQDDGLIKPNVGSWSANKHYFLRRYLDAFTTAMHKKGWTGLHYIDLFAGSGIEQIEGNGMDWGSPLIAAQLPRPFDRLHLCEKRKLYYSALEMRLKKYPQPQTPQVLNGDANLAVEEIVSALPAKALSVAFLDAYGLHAHFHTIRQLSTKRVDLIIFFPDHLDALRNWKLYRDQSKSNLDKVLGTTRWRKQLVDSPQKLAEILLSIYVAQIKTLGYQFFDFERIARLDGRFLYRLIFCSRDEAGLTIWKGISLRKADGQGTFGF